MKKFLASILSILAPLAALAAPAEPLLEPAALAALLKQPNVRVIDIRDGQNAQGKTPYDLGHIPGAVHAPYRFWRGPEKNPGQMRDIDYLGELVARLGVERDTRAVVVFEGRDSTDFGAAARVYWTLRYIGVQRPAILNGGMRAWRAAGLPVDTADVRIPVSNFDPHPQRQLLAARDDVLKLASSAVLIDGRPVAYFNGEKRHPLAKVPGTIAGAKNLDSHVWFRDGSAVMLPPAELRAVAAKFGVTDNGTTLSFCNTGHWAATNWFVLSEMLGHRDVRLYPESLVEWSQAGLPMANVPGRLQQLWQQLKTALQD
ncbi:MAG TPA: rhodanese-like domain-containing protein [Burkholderiaceae bacterium]|jgi:thiosulfate/3-mercaptopyruvate sulfurtransferase|nr:rhodanese-like domain-containing protein [Burkholderiaceae bacterium]